MRLKLRKSRSFSNQLNASLLFGTNFCVEWMHTCTRTIYTQYLIYVASFIIEVCVLQTTYYWQCCIWSFTWYKNFLKRVTVHFWGHHNYFSLQDYFIISTSIRDSSTSIHKWVIFTSENFCKMLDFCLRGKFCMISSQPGN